jgi:hypothetical protein
MTNGEMISEVRIGYDAFYSASAPGFTNDEIVVVLNKAQDQFILSMANNLNFIPIRNLLSNTTGNLTSNTTVGLVSTNSLKVYHVTIPADCWKVLSAEIYLNRTTAGSSGMFPEIQFNTSSGMSWTRGEICDDVSLITKFVDSVSNNKIILPNPMVFIGANSTNTATILLDEYSNSSSYNLQYIKARPSINSTTADTTCILDIMYHRNIVDMGIEILKQYVGYGNNQQQQ